VNAQGLLFRRPYTWAALAGLTLLAGGIRGFRLGEWSLETDEAFTIHDALHAFEGREAEYAPKFPVGYTLVRWALGSGPVFREVEARWLPALAGTLTVPAAAIAFAPIVGGGASLLGALGLALAPWHVYWSQYARYYAFLVLFVVVFLGCFHHALERRHVGAFLAALAALALAVGTHATAGFLLPALLPFLLLAARPLPLRGREGRRLGLRAGIAGLGVLALLAVGAFVFPEAFTRHFLRKPGASPGLYAGTLAYWARPPLLAAAAIAAAFGVARRERGILYLALASFGPIVLAAGAAFRVRANAQYVVFTIPVLFALAGWGVVQVSRRAGPWLGAGLLAAVGADLLGELALYYGPFRGHRPAWKEASAFVWRHAGPEDLLVSTQAPIVDFYLRPGATQLRRPGRVYLLSGYVEEDFERARHRAPRVWYVLGDADLEDWPADMRGLFLARLREEARLVAEWKLQIATDDLTVKVYREDL